MMDVDPPVAPQAPAEAADETISSNASASPSPLLGAIVRADSPTSITVFTQSVTAAVATVTSPSPAQSSAPPPPQSPPVVGAASPITSSPAEVSARESSPAATPPPPLPPCPPYTPQFAASRDAILGRLHAVPAQSIAHTNGSGDMLDSVEEPRIMSIPAAATSGADAVNDGGTDSGAERIDIACRACGGTSRSVFNPLVPCRHCARRWHRMCHVPAIPDWLAAGVWDAAGSTWRCVTCERQAMEAPIPAPVPVSSGVAADLSVGADANVLSMPAAPSPRRNDFFTPPPDVARRVGWEHHTAHERRAFAAGLAPREMAYWLLRAVERHPDLPMFPPDDDDDDDPDDDNNDDADADVELDEGAATTSSRLRPRPLREGVPSRTVRNRREAVGGPDVSATIPRPYQRLPAALPPPTGMPGPITAAAVVAAACSDPQYRNGIINSIRKSHAAALAAAAKRNAASAAASRNRGRPPKGMSAAVAASAGVSISTVPSPGASSSAAFPAAGDMHPPTPPPACSIPSFEATPMDAVEEDPTGLMAGWPQPGQGLYARLGPDWVATPDTPDGAAPTAGSNTEQVTALVDTADYASFSTAVYNASGKKIAENGLPVLVL